MADSEFQADGAIKLNQSSPKDLKLRFGIFESLSALLDAAWVCKNSEIVLRFCRLHRSLHTPKPRTRPRYFYDYSSRMVHADLSLSLGAGCWGEGGGGRERERERQ